MPGLPVTAPILTVEDLSVRYGVRVALSGVTLTVDPGQSPPRDIPRCPLHGDRPAARYLK